MRSLPAAFLVFLAACLPMEAETPSGRAPSSANPVLPGYYADPSIVSYEGKHYIYATLDPWGGKTLGCWESADFKNWTFRELNWPTRAACTSPTSGSADVWAPSVVRHPDGRFVMAISVGNEVWMGVADHPLGPWRDVLEGRPFVTKDYKPGFHMIDAELFVDDDKAVYVYWGSGYGWKNGRCWMARLSDDLKSFAEEPRDVTPRNYFEGPFMVKRHGKYFLTYSQGVTIKDTYQVHYAVGDNPYGPFVEAENSPVLVTDRALNVVSPGHHSIFREGDKDYLLYHRHSIPFDPKFIGRQTCVDEMRITADGRIAKIVPTHAGPALVQGRAESRSLALGAVATASSHGSELTTPAFVVDDNYATLWKAAPDAKGGWVQLDLGAVKDIGRQIIRPEYAAKPSRFLVEASTDGKEWRMTADFVARPAVGSPVVVEESLRARYLRVVFPEDVAGADISLIEWGVFEAAKSGQPVATARRGARSR